MRMPRRNGADGDMSRHLAFAAAASVAAVFMGIGILVVGVAQQIVVFGAIGLAVTDVALACAVILGVLALASRNRPKRQPPITHQNGSQHPTYDPRVTRGCQHESPTAAQGQEIACFAH